VIRGLNLSFCLLSTLAGLKPLPRLTVLIADGSQIATFQNFVAVPNLQKLSLLGTPVSCAPHFALSALLVCPNLVTLNGRQPSVVDRRRAEAYPSLGKALVNAGWLAEFPIPSEDRLYGLEEEFGLVPELPAVETVVRVPSAEVLQVHRFEARLGRLWKRHEAVVQRARELSEEESSVETGPGQVEDDVDEREKPVPRESLLVRLAGVLKEHCVEVDDGNLYSSVLHAIDGLCAEAHMRRSEVGGARHDSNEDEDEEESF
jgi:hypothetical protein